MCARALAMRGPRCDAVPAGARRRRLLGRPVAAMLAAAVWAAACAGPDSPAGPPTAPPPAAADFGDLGSAPAADSVEDAGGAPAAGTGDGGDANRRGGDGDGGDGSAPAAGASGGEGSEPAAADFGDLGSGPAAGASGGDGSEPAAADFGDLGSGPAAGASGGDGSEPAADSVEDAGGAPAAGTGDGGDGDGGGLGGGVRPREWGANPRVPGAPVREGEGPLRVEGSLWEAVLGETFDLCDYRQAAAAVIGRLPEPGEEFSGSTLHHIEEIQPKCDGGGPRFAHITWHGPGPDRASVEEAIEAVSEWPWTCVYGCGYSLGRGGRQLGYEAPHGVFAVQDPVDEVALLWDSVAVRGGALLGLVQNRSAALFARSVTVALDGGSWVFPLTVQPGEVAPFVIDGVAQLPERSQIEVSAVLSPQPDLSRAFEIFGVLRRYPTYSGDGTWIAERLARPQLALNLAALDPPLGAGDRIRVWTSDADLVEPNSHPGAGRAKEQTIEDLRAYLTVLDEDNTTVLAVHRLTPYRNLPVSARRDQYGSLDERVLVPVSALPIQNEYLDGPLYRFDLEFAWLEGSEYDALDVGRYVLHIGGAAPAGR